ncbi:UPF0415 protein C7orf25 homolog isoform X1 [Schistocerca nitens]|uniref:UPF0415 protein C7orf25 homolog isoform X1 n=2 Tax=Schistocerca nitens TaxID=7011 RepID=UPI0021177B84|nr:UPF0415 protein C7orf25 homolog isoform X1 [Schistocerca nitens]
MSSEELKTVFDEKIHVGQELLAYLTKHGSVRGIAKLKKKINVEICFLTKVLNSGHAKMEHALTSNITWYEALISVMKLHDDITAVLEAFSVELETGTKKLSIDIVVKHGYEWIKVIAKNARNVICSLEGDCSYGKRTYIDQAKDILLCAEKHALYFKTPKVVFVFTRGVDEETVKCLTDLGVTVRSIGNEYDWSEKNKDESKGTLENQNQHNTTVFSCSSLKENKNGLLAHVSDIQCLNLDVTTVLAYVSDLTNGGCYFDFDDPCINYQAEQERKEPLKPLLDKLFVGKQLICCQSAYESFSSIIDTVGGESEKKSASQFMEKVLVVNDILSQEFENIKLGGKIKKRSLIVFATGHAMRSVTVTANEGFCRASLNKGIRFAVFLHQPRALTENMKKKIISRSKT